MIMAFLYIGTFGSFIGFAGVFPPKLIKDYFPDFSSIHVGAVALSLAFLGPLVGSLARPYGGRMADRMGGARMTIASFASMAVITLTMIWTLPPEELLALPHLVPAALPGQRLRKRCNVPHDPGHLRNIQPGSPCGRPERHHRTTRFFLTGPDLRDRRLRRVRDSSGAQRFQHGQRLLYPGVLRIRWSYVLMLTVCWVCYIRPRPEAQHDRTHLDAQRRRYPLPVLRAPVRHDADPPGCTCSRGSARAGGSIRPPALGSIRARLPPHQPGRAVPQRLDIGVVIASQRPRHRTDAQRFRRRASAHLVGPSTHVHHRCVKDTQQQYGNDAVGVFGGGGLTNEKAYLLGKFARLALRTSRIDYNGRFCMSSAAAAGNRAFGVDRGLPFPVTDLDTASVILMLGSNVAETMPPFVQHLQGARDAGGLIVVDPRRSATAAFTSDGGGLHLQPTPGTDLALLLGISMWWSTKDWPMLSTSRPTPAATPRWCAACPRSGPSACSPSPASLPP